MSPHSIVFLASLVTAILVAGLLCRLLLPSLRSLLDEIIGLPAATDFYLRLPLSLSSWPLPRRLGLAMPTSKTVPDSWSMSGPLPAGCRTFSRT